MPSKPLSETGDCTEQSEQQEQKQECERRPPAVRQESQCSSQSSGEDSPSPVAQSSHSGCETDEDYATTMPSWIAETIRAAERDTRRQPWRAIFGAVAVDCRFDDGEDLVRIERSVGGRFDPDCPFRTQGSSLAA